MLSAFLYAKREKEEERRRKREREKSIYEIGECFYFASYLFVLFLFKKKAKLSIGARNVRSKIPFRQNVIVNDLFSSYL